jgi:fumarate hydratase class II
MRTERDTFGEMTVPDDALYGASTARAIRNFPISGRPMPEPFLRSLALVKAVCARTNEELGRLDPEKSRLIQQAAAEIGAGGLLTRHFPVDVFQTGSATSTNTNMSTR